MFVPCLRRRTWRSRFATVRFALRRHCSTTTPRLTAASRRRRNCGNLLSVAAAAMDPPDRPSLTTVTRSTHTQPLARLLAPSLFLVQLVGVSLGAQTAPSRVASSDTLVAIVGATVIDGNGGSPITDATIVVRGRRIAALGPRASVQ